MYKSQRARKTSPAVTSIAAEVRKEGSARGSEGGKLFGVSGRGFSLCGGGSWGDSWRDRKVICDAHGKRGLTRGGLGGGRNTVSTGA